MSPGHGPSLCPSAARKHLSVGPFGTCSHTADALTDPMRIHPLWLSTCLQIKGPFSDLCILAPALRGSLRLQCQQLPAPDLLSHVQSLCPILRSHPPAPVDPWSSSIYPCVSSASLPQDSGAQSTIQESQPSARSEFKMYYFLAGLVRTLLSEHREHCSRSLAKGAWGVGIRERCADPRGESTTTSWVTPRNPCHPHHCRVPPTKSSYFQPPCGCRFCRCGICPKQGSPSPSPTPLTSH